MRSSHVAIQFPRFRFRVNATLRPGIRASEAVASGPP